MRFLRSVVLALLVVSAAFGQAKVPPLVRFNGTWSARQSSGSTSSNVATFTVYATEGSAKPLWSEVQQITIDKDGNYSVLLGSGSAEGIPASAFQNGESRWLEVEIDGVRQPRVMLVSVPYALKASDADTLGGLPVSAFLRAGTSAVAPNSATPTSATAEAVPVVHANTASSTGSNGTANYLAMFSDASNIVNSAIHQSGNTVSIGATTDSLGALTLIGNVPGGDAAGMALYNAGGGAGASVSLDMYNTWSNGGIPQAKVKATDDGAYSDHLTFWTKVPGAPTNPVNERMRITSTGNVGIGTTSPAQKLEVNGNAQIDGNITLSGSLYGAGGVLFKVPNDHSDNFGAGLAALAATTTGTQNTATGSNALNGTTTGNSNTAVGYSALARLTTGGSNTAVGSQALTGNGTGVGNIAIGAGALTYTSSGNYNVAVGYGAGGLLPSGSQNIYVGSVSPSSAESGVIRIGAPYLQTSTYIAGIYAATTGFSNAIPVLIDSNGQLGTLSSSRRYKEDIHDMNDASSGLMRLRPVTFRYKKAFADGTKPVQYGLIAEEVAEVYPDLVSRNSAGEIETVKYEVLDSMLLNEVQKLRVVNDVQQKHISELEERLRRLEAAVAAR